MTIAKISLHCILKPGLSPKCWYYLLQSNFKIYDVTDWITSNAYFAMHILLNISRNKGNQTMKVGQLIVENINNNFFKYHAQSMMEKLVPDPFIRKSKLSISLDQHSEMFYNLFILHV